MIRLVTDPGWQTGEIADVGKPGRMLTVRVWLAVLLPTGRAMLYCDWHPPR
jgi:hypothetical protein